MLIFFPVMLRIPLDEKIHVIEMYPDQGHSLLAVGLKSGLAIIGLVLDDEDALTGYQVPTYVYTLTLQHHPIISSESSLRWYSVKISVKFDYISLKINSSTRSF